VHTIEVSPGVVTPGFWELRPAAKNMPWPHSPAGLRRLDVGTMAGFEVEAETGIFGDHAGPAVGRLPLPAGLSHRVGIRGRSAAIRARAV